MDCKLDYDAFGLVAGGSISLMSRPGRTFARAAACSSLAVDLSFHVRGELIHYTL